MKRSRFFARLSTLVLTVVVAFCVDPASFANDANHPQSLTSLTSNGLLCGSPAFWSPLGFRDIKDEGFLGYNPNEPEVWLEDLGVYYEEPGLPPSFPAGFSDQQSTLLGSSDLVSAPELIVIPAEPVIRPPAGTVPQGFNFSRPTDGIVLIATEPPAGPLAGTSAVPNMISEAEYSEYLTAPRQIFSFTPRRVPFQPRGPAWQTPEPWYLFLP